MAAVSKTVKQQGSRERRPASRLEPCSRSRRWKASVPLGQRGLTLELPSGATWEREGSRQGYGLTSVEAADLTQAQVEHALTHRTEVVVEDGEVRAIVGDGTDGVEKVIVSIIGGTIVAASSSTAYNDDCESTVRLDKNENPHHATRDGKPIDEVTTLIEVIENPTRIVDAGAKRYYILRLGTNRVLVVSTRIVSEAYQILKTTLTGNGPDSAFRTLDDAMDAIRDTHGNDYEVVHDPEKGGRLLVWKIGKQ